MGRYFWIGADLQVLIQNTKDYQNGKKAAAARKWSGSKVLSHGGRTLAFPFRFCGICRIEILKTNTGLV